jgi:NAD(P)-dependent dehydrogenase (short-subunit alcohol dehydrogenase family)
MTQSLDGQVALVAGATRAAGRGIALELAAAGAKVYCTGRSTQGRPATPGRTETIDETADMIADAGGAAVAVRVDHMMEVEVEALAALVRSQEGRLDILVNDIWGGDGLIDWGAKFWAVDIAKARRVLDQALFSHLITSRHLAPLMVEAKRGLIVEVTDGEMSGYRGQLLYDLVKSSVNRLAYDMAWDLVGTGVTALAVTPGFLRSEAMLDRFSLTEANWREAVKDPKFAHPDFAFSESPRFVGRAIAALAADPDVAAKAGTVLFADDLADEYGFDDLDGSRPHFWRSMEAWLEREMASEGKLDPRVRWVAESRYMNVHLTPARAGQARAYAERLGLDSLGAGLRPLGN